MDGRVSAPTPTTCSAGGTPSRSATTTTSRTRRSPASWPSSARSAARSSERLWPAARRGGLLLVHRADPGRHRRLLPRRRRHRHGRVRQAVHPAEGQSRPTRSWAASFMTDPIIQQELGVDRDRRRRHRGPRPPVTRQDPKYTRLRRDARRQRGPDFADDAPSVFALQLLQQHGGDPARRSRASTATLGRSGRRSSEALGRPRRFDARSRPDHARREPARDRQQLPPAAAGRQTATARSRSRRSRRPRTSTSRSAAPSRATRRLPTGRTRSAWPGRPVLDEAITPEALDSEPGRRERRCPVAAAPTTEAPSRSSACGGSAGASAACRPCSDVDLDIAHGERRAILGPNGAGKTTLFNVIAGEFPPSAGTIELFGAGRHGPAGPQRRRASA